MEDDTEEVRLTLRLPIKVRDRLTERGKINGRSLNAEIVSRLEQTILEEQEERVSIFEYAEELARRLDVVERVLRIAQPGKT